MCWREAPGADLPLGHRGDGSEGVSGFSQCPLCPSTAAPSDPAWGKTPPALGPGVVAAGWTGSPRMPGQMRAVLPCAGRGCWDSAAAQRQLDVLG